jgi:hypothetical protein
MMDKKRLNGSRVGLSNGKEILECTVSREG